MNSENTGHSKYQELEQRIGALKKKRNLKLILAAVCLAIAVASLFELVFLVFIPAGISALILAFMGLSDGRKLKQMAKSHIVEEALAEVLEGCVYNPGGRIDGASVRDAGLIDEWDEDRDSFDTEMRFDYTGNDHITGKYQGCEIELCDAKVTKVTKRTEEDDDGKETEREDSSTVFRGLWMICKLEKPLPATVRVRERAERTPFSPLKKIAGERVRAKSDVETENQTFNEQFQILTNDPHSAFYVLTPHFMEHILSADKKAAGRTMLCFSGSRVHIAVHTGKDSFEIKKSSDSADLPALKQRIQGEVQYITGILDELFRNESLF